MLVFGGSFDPPHRGHLALLKAAAETIGPERILIIPAGHAPLKDAPAAPASARWRMIQLGLVQPLPRRFSRLTRVDNLELRLKRKVYTLETLRRLRRRQPGTRLHFLVGSDSATSFDAWRAPAALKKLAVWWTGRRLGVSGDIPPHFRRLPGTYPRISSSGIREALSLGQNPAAWLHPAVLGFILKKKLYGRDLLARLSETLSPERYTHSLAVAVLAVELARRWGLNASRAARAGLLHDCGRTIPVPELPAYARRRKLRIPAFVQTAAKAPLLLHAYAGEDLARRRFGVDDPEILSAIRHHTLGNPAMKPLDRLLYVADACSRDRTYPQASVLRAEAFVDMNKAFRNCVKNKINTARAFGSWLHPITLRLWRDLR